MSGTGSRPGTPTGGSGGGRGNGGSTPPPPSPPPTPSPPGTPPPPPPGYHPVFHTAGQLPAPEGDIAKAMDATPKDVQRDKAEDLFNFLLQPNADLRELNHDNTHVFIGLVSVPKTHKVRVVYAPAVGTAGIGRQSAISGKLLVLHGEGNQLLGPPSVMVFDSDIVTSAPTTDPGDAHVDQVFRSGTHAVERSIGAARDHAGRSNVLRFVPIPAYFVYDGFNDDLHAAVVYERLREAQSQSLWKDHALTFLRSCMVGNWRNNDPKPFLDIGFFRDTPHREAKIWAATRTQNLFPQIMTPAALGGGFGATPQVPTAPVQLQHGPGGANGSVVSLSTDALKEILTSATATRRTGEEKKDSDDGDFKVSEHEKELMRKLCGLPAGSEAFPHWFKAIHAQHVSDNDKANIIAKLIRSTFIYEDAEVPLYADLLKGVRTRNWTAQDMGLIASFENAAKGISPFAMFDFTSEDIAVMGSEATDLEKATVVTTSDLKSARKKLKAVVPKDGQALLLTLKRFGNFLFALFTSESPLFKELAKIIKAFKKITLNARINLPHHVRATIMWIILLQSRVFAEGDMLARADSDDVEGCLGEFINLKNAIMAKSLAGLNHEDMPDQLRYEQGRTDTDGGAGKRTRGKSEQGVNPGVTPDDPPTKTPRQTPARNGYNKEFVDGTMVPALAAAGNPTLHEVCQFCGVTRENLMPDFNCRTDCIKFALTGKCEYGNKCRFHHLTVNKKQEGAVRTKLKRFLDNPAEIKKPGKPDTP